MTSGKQRVDGQPAFLLQSHPYRETSLVVDVFSRDFVRVMEANGFSRRSIVYRHALHNRGDLLTQLADNLTDLAVMVRPPDDADTVAEPFAPHPYLFVAPRDHPLVAERGIALSRLVREPFIVREPGSDTRHSMADALGRHHAHVNVALQVKSTETIKQAVIAGLKERDFGIPLQFGNFRD